MRCFTVPAVEGGKGDPRLFHGQGMEFLFVPKDARHPDLAFDFARYLVSPRNAPDMGRSIGIISPLARATPRDAVTPALQSVLDLIENSDGVFNVRPRELLLEWRAQVMNPAMATLLRGEITPQQFARQLDLGVQTALKDPDLIVPPYVPYVTAGQ
jgi:ABC-type glycerol-3-phosphate transport system substrate-binding protein